MKKQDSFTWPGIHGPWENLSAPFKLSFLSAGVLGLITHIYLFTNLLLNHDSCWRLYYDNNNTHLGRWAVKWFSDLSTQFQTPVVIGVISILALALTAALTIETLEITNKFTVIFASGFIAIFPSVTSILSYLFTADAFLISLLLNALAAYCAKKYRYGWIVSIALCTVACGIYQAFICYTIGLLLMDCIQKLLAEVPVRKVLVTGLKYISVILGVRVLVSSYLYAQFSLKETLLKGLPEIFALQTFGQPGEVFSVLWFVSSLIWASVLVYYLLLKNRDFCIYIAFPFGLLIFMGWIRRINGCIAIYNNNKIFMGTFLRAFFEIALGCIIYRIYLAISRYKWNSLRITAIEIGLLSIILLVMWGTRPDYKDFIMVFVIGAFVLITALNQGHLTKLLNNKIFAGCGAISYALYVNHRTIQMIVFQFPGHPFWMVTALSLTVSILYSAVVTVCLDWCSKQKKREIEKGCKSVD